MTKAEAAQKWAEAKEALDVAQAALDAAHTAHNDAVRTESDAWEALQAMAGRVAPPLEAVPEEAEILKEEILYMTGQLGHQTRPVYRHSLPVKPIG